MRGSTDESISDVVDDAPENVDGTGSSRVMTVSEAEDAAMLRAFGLAANGPQGLNPQVGAVILSPTGSVLAEGWHRGAGTPHAEVDALTRLGPAGARGATVAVTLEPCNHSGRTGPCAQALIDAGVARVLYSVADPTPEARGGAARLAAAGIDVEGGVRREEGESLLGMWLQALQHGRPFVVVKWAQSLDGRAAAADGTSRWITGPESRSDVHRRRADADAIVVGTGTILADDPALTARSDEGLHGTQPQPVVIGRRQTPSGAAVHRHPKPPLFFHTDDLVAVLTDLRSRGIRTVFVEGGPSLASAFLREGLVDEVLVYVAPVLLGGDRLALTDLGIATIADARRLSAASVTHLGDDILITAHPVPRGED